MRLFTHQERKIILTLFGLLLLGSLVSYIRNDRSETFARELRFEGIDSTVVTAIAESTEERSNADGLREPGDFAAEKMDLNSVAIEDLCSLHGIGEKTAIKIIAKREEMGGFKTIEDLKLVKGIGEKKFSKLKPLITVETGGNAK